jgi:RsiW-degrading membrane proteinase PrsW (M82 family)
MKRSYPPPPPPPEPAHSPVQRGFHGPSTNFFPGIRARLAALEGPSQLPAINSLSRGLWVSLIFAGSIGFGLAWVIETAVGPSVGADAILVFLAPLIEEILKALAMIFVVYLMWRIVPNRRYGAVLGAAAGLGFGAIESVKYIIGFVVSGAYIAIPIRIIVTPLMHPLWSAFVGVGVFALVASSRASRPDVPKSPVWLPWLFLLLGLTNHMVWNSIVDALGSVGLLPIILNVIFVFPLFALMLRDLLGGHFNFQDFLQPIPEEVPSYPAGPPLPPPPPPTLT